jgi:hypothetical protein
VGGKRRISRDKLRLTVRLLLASRLLQPRPRWIFPRKPRQCRIPRQLAVSVDFSTMSESDIKAD